MTAMHKLFRVCGLTLFAAGLFGCDAFNSDDSNRDRDYDLYGRSRTSSDRYDPYYERGRTDVDPGTARKIPRDAQTVAEGRRALAYTARGDGVVYIYDVDAQVSIYDARLRDGDRFVLNPEESRITINGRDQTRIDINRNHNFRILFLSERYRSYGY